MNGEVVSKMYPKIVTIDLVDSDEEPRNNIFSSQEDKIRSESLTVKYISSDSDSDIIDLCTPACEKKDEQEDPDLMASIIRAKAMFRYKIRTGIHTPSIATSLTPSDDSLAPKIGGFFRKRHLKLFDELESVLHSVRRRKEQLRAKGKSIVSRPLISVTGRPLRRNLLKDFLAESTGKSPCRGSGLLHHAEASL